MKKRKKIDTKLDRIATWSINIEKNIIAKSPHIKW